MTRKRRRSPREKDLTARWMGGEMDEDRVDARQRFSRKSAGAEQRKIERTALLRMAEEAAGPGIETLPVGQVAQVYSLFSEVRWQGELRLCVVRKTVSRLLDSPIVVGDRVHFRDLGVSDDRGRPAAVIERLLPRQTVLTRAESFKAKEQQPIVANAEQILIVASLLQPRVRWGLVDRMIVAAEGGRLRPILCLNKIDLADSSQSAAAEMDFAREALRHYQSLGVGTLLTSALSGAALDLLRETLRGRSTVLAGHSGVGKSSLVHALQPALNLRIAPVSGYTGKGRHTTASARWYDLDFGGQVIDTPGVKAFGLWGVTSANLLEYFPDVEAETAPEWRKDSYQRMLESLAE